LYKPTVDWAAKDAPVIAVLNEIVAKRSRWGFGKCFHRLRADGHGWNHKRVHRVCCAMKLNLQRKAKKRLVTRERQPLQTHREVNRAWALDFMRDTMYDGRPFRTLNVIDEGNREALRIECGTSIPSARLVQACLIAAGSPPCKHSSCAKPCKVVWSRSGVANNRRLASMHQGDMRARA
jgi:putative transposase